MNFNKTYNEIIKKSKNAEVKYGLFLLSDLLMYYVLRLWLWCIYTRASG